MAAIPETSSSNDFFLKVTSIAAFSKGFVCSGGPGVVHLFEKTDEKDGFKKTREIKVPIDAQSPDPQAAIANHVVSTLTVSPSEETLVCSTKANQLYCITMSSADLGKVRVLSNNYMCIAGLRSQIFVTDAYHFQFLPSVLP